MSGAPVTGARRAGPGDLADMSDLLRLARDTMTSERGGPLLLASSAIAEPLEASLGDLLIADDHLVVVGTVDDVVVGGAIARSSPLGDGSSLAVLDVLFVEPAARGIGVGEEMLGAVERWSEELGLAGIDATALPGMRETKNFFEAAGFVARLIVMHRPGSSGHG